MRTLLIANRGEIAVRVIRTARTMGLRTIAVYSDADADAPHVAMADSAVRLGPPPAAESYLRSDLILAAARATGSDAIHPGYGFLSENADFAEACAAAGIIFVGPPPAAIRAMGLKDAAKRLMREAGVPVTPGYMGEDQSLMRLESAARAIGYPLLIKAVAGGGGKGMRRVDSAPEFAEALVAAQREASRAFGDDRVLIEKFIARARHVEVQVFADAHGNAVHLFERDCSAQRRHQKVIEEAPAPGLSPRLRAAFGEAAVAAARAVGYVNAGTIEFIMDAADTDEHGDPKFYFMEMNTRLQVEHPVTEMVTRLDLVAWQLRIARGEALPLTQDQITLDGHAVEARLYAEDADNGFLPQTGTLSALDFPALPGVRIDSGVRAGQAITPFYDPMIAKVIAHGPDRPAALQRLADALDGTLVRGVTTNRAFLARLTSHPAFAAGDISTAFIAERATELAPDVDPPPLAVAAAAFAIAGAAPQAGPFARFGDFRLNLPVERRIDLWDGPRHHALALKGGALHGLTPEPLSLTARRHGRHIELMGAPGEPPYAAWADVDADHVTVSAGGQSFRFARHAPRAGAGGDLSFDGRVKAPMPGRVLSVHVRPGQRVEPGDRLLVLEAMKMEHRLSAPAAGSVTRVGVAAGDQVSEGAPLIEIAAD
jgi:3-methylcrotonyl-CoA carboxylase alpha subunit